MSASAAVRTIRLRDYQQEAVEAVLEAYRSGINRPLVVLPTGCGKTIVFAEAIRRRLHLGRALVLAHRDELLQQAAEKIRLVIPDAKIGFVQGPRNEVHAPIVIASVQTLSRPGRLAQLKAKDIKTVVIDEAHHAVRDNQTYNAILMYLNAYAQDDPPLVLGMTATPQRTDETKQAGRQLRSVWQRIVYRKPLIEMIAKGHLSDVRAVQVMIEADLSRAYRQHGDYDDSESGRILMDAGAPEFAVRAYQQYAAGRKTIAFVPSVELANQMAAAFNEAGIRSEAVSGATPPQQRAAILYRLHTGKTTVVTNCAVLTEGFDEPSVSCIIMCRPTRSKALYIQCVGRGTRKYPGKEDCLILDLVGVTEQHDLITASRLFDKPAKALAEKGVAELELEALEPPQELISEQPELVDTSSAKLIAQKVNPFHDRNMRWVQAGKRWTLQTTSTIFALEQREDSDLWDVYSYRNGGKEQELIAAALPLEYAQGVAEDRVRESGETTLLDPQAAWRDDPATMKQLETLAKLGVSIDAQRAQTLTRGEASDMIATEKARRVLSWSGPATARQKWRLRQLHIPFGDDITKADASRLIDEALQRFEEEQDES